MADLNFSRGIGGIPEIAEEKTLEDLTPKPLRGIKSSEIVNGCMVGIDARKDDRFSLESN